MEKGLKDGGKAGGSPYIQLQSLDYLSSALTLDFCFGYYLGIISIMNVELFMTATAIKFTT